MKAMRLSFSLYLLFIYACSSGQKQNIEKLNDEAFELLNQRKYSQAIELCNEIISKHPKHYNAYYTRGLVYHTLKDYQKAIEDYTTAIKYDDDFFSIYLNRGSVYLKQEKYEKALDDFKIAVELEPANIESLNNLGLAYYHLGNCKMAIENYDHAIILSPQTGYLYYNKGHCYAASMNFDEACNLWRQALQAGLTDTNEINGIHDICDERDSLRLEFENGKNKAP
jgi:tetratricopeptide (TPR) repeat protein